MLSQIIFFGIFTVVSYLIGAIPFGFIIGKCHGIDIREHGSKNIGATNVTRVIGKKWGRLCFLCDFLKSAIPVFLAVSFSKHNTEIDSLGIIPVISALQAVLGHVFPVYLKFKGGKGVSTAAGAVFALNPPALICVGLIWIVVFEIWRYVSLASICAAAALPLAAILLKDVYPISAVSFWLLVLLAILTVAKHHSNIKRLVNGTESKFVKK